MRKEDTSSRKSPVAIKTKGHNFKNPARSSQVQADDPLFVTQLEVLKITAERSTEGGDEYSAFHESISDVTDHSQPVAGRSGIMVIEHWPRRRRAKEKGRS